MLRQICALRECSQGYSCKRVLEKSVEVSLVPAFDSHSVSVSAQSVSPRQTGDVARAMAEVRYLLFESASGYALVERKGSEEIGVQSEEAQRSMTDFGRFSQICSLKSYLPFTSAENALANINDISEGLMTDELREFLESNLGKALKGGKEKVKFALGVSDPKIGGTVQEATGIPCVSNDLVHELLRGVRMHFSKLVKVSVTSVTRRAAFTWHAVLL